MKGLNMKGIYIHIPFCVRKCKYCDFVSYPDKTALADEYVSALKKEAKMYRGEKADTIFIGGGTPSLLTPKQIETVCRMCFDTFDIPDDYEFTMEINPGTVDDDKINAMLSGGVNRVSVGVQSFCDEELRRIGRIHDAKTAYNTIWQLKENGFSNINIDIMTALPSQNITALSDTLNTAVKLPITHISAYSLIMEEGTALYDEYSNGAVTLPNDDDERDMYAFTKDFLNKNGFARYEISNFARDGFECRHNIKYWTFEEYVGLGAAAHSYMDGKRFYNTSILEEYIMGAEKTVTLLTRDDEISEYIITGLRMDRGIDAARFAARFNERIEDIYGDKLKKFISLGLIKSCGGFYSLTDRGIDVSNSVLCEFV